MFFAGLSIASSASLLLCGYEFIRSASNTLFKLAYGAERLPLVMALVPLAVAAVLFVYGELLRATGPRRTLWITTVGSGALIAGAWALVNAGWSPATIFLYLFREAYVVLLIEQYWSYLNSVLSEAEAKRWNGPIIGWSSLGAIAGGWLVHSLAEPLGTPAMLLFAAGALVPGALLSDLAYARQADPDAEAKSARHPRKDLLSLGLLRRSPLLFWLFVLILVTQVVGTSLTLHFQGMLQIAIPERDAQTAFSGQFYAWLNTAAAVLQFAAAPIVLRRLSVVLVLVLIPALTLGGSAWAALSPSIFTAGAAYLTFKAFDYSLFRAAKEVLYIPLTFDARFRAKEVIDVFGYRFGKGLTSLSIALLQRVGIVFEGVYPWIAWGGAAAWIGVAGLIGRARGRHGTDPSFERSPATA